MERGEEQEWRREAPAVSHFSEISVAPERRIELDNGVRVHLVNQGALPLTKVCVLYDGGALDFGKCVTQVMSAGVCEGSEKMSGEEIAETIDYCGGRMAGSVSDHYTGIEMVTLNSQFERMLEVLMTVSTQSVFPDRAVERIKMQLANTQKLNRMKVSYRASKRLEELMRGLNRPASKIVLPEDYYDVKPEDVREVYGKITRGPVHVYAGGMIDGRIEERLCRTFSELKPGGLSPIRIEKDRPESVTIEKIEMPDSLQSAIEMGTPTIGRDHEDYINLRLTVMALGGYFGSRLMRNIREEKGLTYGISSSLLGTREGAYVDIGAQCDKSYVEEVISETRREIVRLATNPPRGEELDRLRLHAWTVLATGTDTAFGTLEYYITHRRVGTPKDYFRQQLEAIRGLDSEKIAEMATKYLRPENLSTVIVGS